MKLNKIFLLAGIALAGVFAACSDDDDYEKGAVASGNQLQTVTFGAKNIYSAELDPSDPTSCTITVYRDSAHMDQAATVPLKVLTNTDNVFVVPASAEFAAGKAEAEVLVTFNNAEIGVPYDLEIGLDDSYVNPYSAATFNTYAVSIQRVKWNDLGVGYWCDAFWYGYISEVNVYQRDDQPATYRIESPYTDEYVQYYVEETGDEDTQTGTYQKWLVFNTTKTGLVTFNNFYINTYYAYYGAEIYAQFYSGNAENCLVVKNDEGGIRYFQINPRFYMDGVGGWSAYFCYLVFPDQRFPDIYYDDEDEEEGDEGEGEGEGEE
jgi:hypothetical protein